MQIDETPGDDGLTDGERAEVNADAAGTTAATEAAPATPESDAEPEPATPETPDAALVGAKALTDAAGAVSKAAEALAAASTTRAPETTAAQPAAERDFDAERKALKAQYDKGEIDEDRYESERERLLEERADARAAKTINDRLAAARQEQQQEDWSRTVNAFRRDPGNAKLYDDPVRQSTFTAQVHVVAAENPTGTYTEWLAGARDRTLAAFGLLNATDPDAEAKKAAAIEAERKKRDAASGKPPTTLDRAPQAGTATPSGVDAQLDNLPISDLEDTLARMPADKLEQYLATAPGGLRDNPRAG